MDQRMITTLTAFFAFIAGIFAGQLMSNSLTTWEGWFGIVFNVAIIWTLHRMASNIRRYRPPKS